MARTKRFPSPVKPARAAKKSTGQSVNQSANQPTNQSINSSLHQAINQSINQSKKPASKRGRAAEPEPEEEDEEDDEEDDESINQSTSQSSNQSTNRSTNQSANPSINQSTNQSIDEEDAEDEDAEDEEEDDEESTNQSTSQSTNQSANESTSQSINQSAKQSTNRRSSGRARKVPTRFTIVEDWPSMLAVNQSIKNLEEHPSANEESENDSDSQSDQSINQSKRRKTAKGSKKVVSKKKSINQSISQSEEDNDSDGADSDQSIDEKPKKRKRSIKKSTNQSIKQSKKKGSKLKQLTPIEDQSIIEAINQCKSCLSINQLTNQSTNQSINEPDISCCSRCSNRETFRAINQSNISLLNSINQSIEFVSDPLFCWSPDDDRDPLTEVILRSTNQSINQSTNFSMFKILFNQLMVKLAMGTKYQKTRSINQSVIDPAVEIEETEEDSVNNQSINQSTNQLTSQSTNSKPVGRGRGKVAKRPATSQSVSPSTNQSTNQSINQSVNQSNAPGSRVPMPVSSLAKLDTGEKNFHQFGHATRAINASRGGKEGNNAFTCDQSINQSVDDENDNSYYDDDGAFVNQSVNQKIFKKYFHLACQRSTNQYVDWMMNSRSFSDKNFFNQSINQSAGQSTNQSVNQSINQSVDCIFVTNRDDCMKWIGRSMIGAAAEAGNCQVVHHLIGLINQSVSQSINQSASAGFNALHHLVTQSINHSLPPFRAPSATKKSSENNSITPIHLASINQSINYLNQLYQIGGSAALLTTDSHGRTACHYAAVNQSDEVLKWLISKGADISLRDKQGKSPIEFAVMYGRAHNIKHLVPQSLNQSISQSVDDQSINLSVKAESKKKTKSKKAESKKPKPESDDNSDNSNNESTSQSINQSINQSIDLMDDVAEMAEATLKAGGRTKQAKIEAEQAAYTILLNDPIALLNAVDKKTGESILHRACKYANQNQSINQSAVVSELIRLGADATKQDKEKHSPLMIACRSGDLLLAQSIIQSACKRHETHPISISKKTAKTKKFETVDEFQTRLINLGDRCKRSAITHAVKNGKFEIVKMLLLMGVDANTVDSSDNSLVHYSAAYGWTDVLSLLLAANANSAPLNMWKLTPLFIAMLKNHLKVADLLLSFDSQSSIDSVDNEGRSVLFHALFNKPQSIDLAIKQVNWLIVDRKANVHIAEARGQKPLHVLANSTPDVQRWKDVKLAKLLIDCGALADINHQDEQGETPLSLAVSKHHWQLVDLLLQNGAKVLTRTKKSHISPLIYALKIAPSDLPNHTDNRSKPVTEYRELVDRCLKVRSKSLQHRRFIIDALLKAAANESINQSDNQSSDRMSDDDASDQPINQSINHSFDFLNDPTEDGSLPLHLALFSCQPYEDVSALLSIGSVSQSSSQSVNQSINRLKLHLDVTNDPRGFGRTALAALIEHDPKPASVVRPLDTAADDESHDHYSHWNYDVAKDQSINQSKDSQKAAQLEADNRHLQTIKLLLVNGASPTIPAQSAPLEKPKSNKPVNQPAQPVQFGTNFLAQLTAQNQSANQSSTPSTDQSMPKGQLGPNEYVTSKSLIELALEGPKRLRLPIINQLIEFHAPINQLNQPTNDTILHTLFRQALTDDIMQVLNLLINQSKSKSKSKANSQAINQSKELADLMTTVNNEGMTPIHVLIRTISPLKALSNNQPMNQSVDIDESIDQSKIRFEYVYINDSSVSINQSIKQLLQSNQTAGNQAINHNAIVSLLEFCAKLNPSCFSLSIQPINEELLNQSVTHSKKNNQSTNQSDKPHCRYGAQCYRTSNPQHTAAMWHPHIDGNQSANQSSSHSISQSISQSINQSSDEVSVYDELDVLAKEYQSTKQPNKLFTPLHQAVAANDVELVDWLVKQSINQSTSQSANQSLWLTKDSLGRTPLILACQLSSSVEIPKALLQSIDQSINQSSDGSSSSNQSVSQSIRKSINQSIEMVDSAGMNALHCAVEYSARHAADGKKNFEEAFGVESLLIESINQSISQSSNQSVNQSINPLITAKDRYGRTPLHYVFVRRFERYATGSFDAIELLTDLAACASINQSVNQSINQIFDEVDVYQSSPLLYNAMLGGSISGKYLLSKGAQIGRLDCDQNGPFQHALLNNHLHHCVDLVDKGVDFLTSIFDYKSAAKITKKQKDKLIKQSLNQSTNQSVNQSINQWKEKFSISCFKYVLKQNWMGLSFLMMERGISIESALIDSLSNDLFQLSRTLISKCRRSDLLNVSSKGQNLIHIIAACQPINESKTAFETQWCKKLIDLLINLGVDTVKLANSTDNKKRLPIHYAAMNSHNWLIDWLINQSPQSINQLDYQSRSPMLMAVRNNHVSSIVLLANRGANLSTPFVSYDEILAANEKYYSPNQSINQSTSLSKKGKATVQPIVQPVPVIALETVPLDKHTFPPLMLAVRMNQSIDYFLVHLLLTLGADPNAADENQSTSLMYAAKHNDVRLATILLTRTDLPENQSTNQSKMHSAMNPINQSINQSSKPVFKELPMDLNRVDSAGRSAVHAVVIPFGPLQASYENVELLNMVINAGQSINQSKKTSVKHVKPKLDLKDFLGHSALYYANQQATGVLAKSLSAAGAKLSESDRKASIKERDEYLKGQFINQSTSNQSVDLDGDVKALQSWFDAKQGGQDDENSSTVAVDDPELAKTSKVFIDSSVDPSIIYDCTLSFTDTSGYYGTHSFYRMQIVYNASQDLYILSNRWGRFGTRGEIQRTPMSDKATAVKEFEKVFKQKTANPWEDRDKFTVKPGKYTLLRTKQQKSTITVDPHQQANRNKTDENAQVVLPLSFILKKYSSQLPPCTLPSELALFIRTICDLASLKHLSQRLKITQDDKNPLASLSEDQLRQGREILNLISTKIDGYTAAVSKVSQIQQMKNHAMMASFAAMSEDSKHENESKHEDEDEDEDEDVDMESNNQPINQSINQSINQPIDAVLDAELSAAMIVQDQLNGELTQLSNQFYTLVPRADLGHGSLQPIRTRLEVNQQLFRLSQMLDLFIAEKVLMGARWQLQEILCGQKTVQQSIHPVTYCYQSLGVQMRVLPRTDYMYASIEQYMNVSADRKQWELYDVIECCRPAEFDAFQKRSCSIDNHMLLWHGSGKANFAGLLTTGLRIAPPESEQSGLAFGRGVYLADMFSKSIGYCQDQHSNFHSHHHMNSQQQANEVEQDLEIRQSRCLLLCEAAIGTPYPLYEAVEDQFTDVPNGHHSGFAVGRQGPDERNHLVTPDGVRIPLGQIVTTTGHPVGKQPPVNHNEYIVYHESQVRIRYVVRVGPPRKKQNEQIDEKEDDEEQDMVDTNDVNNQLQEENEEKSENDMSDSQEDEEEVDDENEDENEEEEDM